jgi:hypothetical protein
MLLDELVGSGQKIVRNEVGNMKIVVNKDMMVTSIKNIRITNLNRGGGVLETDEEV